MILPDQAKTSIKLFCNWLYRFRLMKSFSMFIAAELACLGLYSVLINGHIEKDGQRSVNWSVTSGEATLYGCFIGLFILIGYLAVLLYHYNSDKRKYETLQDQIQISNDPYKGEKWLKDLMSHFSFYYMDTYFQDMPAYFREPLTDTYDYWNSCLHSSAFQMKDKQLLSLILNFFNTWVEIENYGSKYYCTSYDGQYVKFVPLQHDVIIDPKAEKDFYEIGKKVQELAPKYKAFRDYLDQNYDIDFDQVSSDFAKSLHK